MRVEKLSTYERIRFEKSATIWEVTVWDSGRSDLLAIKTIGKIEVIFFGSPWKLGWLTAAANASDCFLMNVLWLFGTKSIKRKKKTNVSEKKIVGLPLT